MGPYSTSINPLSPTFFFFVIWIWCILHYSVTYRYLEFPVPWICYIFIGIVTDIGENWYRKKVLEPVPEKFGTEKSTGMGKKYWYRLEFWVPSHSEDSSSSWSSGSSWSSTMWLLEGGWWTFLINLDHSWSSFWKVVDHHWCDFLKVVDELSDLFPICRRNENFSSASPTDDHAWGETRILYFLSEENGMIQRKQTNYISMSKDSPH